jgi:hypothetical protein
MKLRSITVALAVSAALVAAQGGGASASTAQPDGAHALATALNRTGTDIAGVSPSQVKSNDSFASLTSNANTQIAVPRTARDGISVTTPAGVSVKIGIAQSATTKSSKATNSSMVTYRGDRLDVAVQATKDGGVRQIFVLKEKAAPSNFTIPVSLPSGFSLVKQADGSVSAYNSKTGATAGAFYAPWALDAKGASVPTSFEVRGNQLIQSVATSSTTSFPVVADPWWGYQWKISATNANRISSALYGGAGVSTIVAILCGGSIVGIPCAVAYGVAAGLLAIGGAAVSYCNAAGRGININMTWNGIVWCTGR